jgi:hypothetical protein
MAELLGTGVGTPMVINGGGDDQNGMMNNPLLWLITLGFLGKSGGLLGGNGNGGTEYIEANTDLINANTSAVVSANAAASNNQIINTISAQNTQNQLNNIQADASTNAQNISQSLAVAQGQNDIKLLLTRIADGNIDMSRQFADCCCDNKVLALQNTAQIVGAVTNEGQLTRALIAQLDKENLVSQLNDAKSQVSNFEQTQTLEAYLNMRFPIPPYGYTATGVAAAA